MEKKPRKTRCECGDIVSRRLIQTTDVQAVLNNNLPLVETVRHKDIVTADAA